MNPTQSQSQAQVHGDGFDQAKSNNSVEKDVLYMALGSSSSNRCPSELRTLHDDENEPSSTLDPEKGATQLAGIYAKYAGEPPDGGLKAWSVILACVDYRIQRMSGTDNNYRGSRVQDWLNDLCGVGGFWF